MTKIRKSENAIKTLQKAREKRAFANSDYVKQLPGENLKSLLLGEADILESEGLALLDADSITVGPGGEALPDQNDEKSLMTRDTMQDPNQVAVTASADRIDLADDAQCLSLAIDAAASIHAANSLEKMLIHNMAACYATAMKLISKIQADDEDAFDTARLANASSKLMNTYQKGLRTLHKIRTGGQQKMTVEHVHVHKGGKAIVGQINQDKGGK